MNDSTTEAERLGPGGNQPPTDLEIFKADLALEVADLRTKINDYTVGIEKATSEEITDDNEPMILSFIKQGGDIANLIESLRVKLKKPHDDKASAVQALLGPKGSMLNLFKPKMTALKDRYDKYFRAKEARIRREREEAERKAREEAERIAREAREAEEAAAELAREAQDAQARQAAAQAIAEASAKKEEAKESVATVLRAVRETEAPVHTHGTYGGTAHTRARETFNITDERALPAAVLWGYVDLAAKEKAIRAAIRDGVTEIEGVEMVTETKTQYR